MSSSVSRVLIGLCTLTVTAWTAPVLAQSAEVKEKPPLYTYIANWAIPRAKWADMEKSTAADQKLLEKGIASGALVSYGDDTAVVHDADGNTHDNWWSSMSMGGLLSELEEFYKSGSATSAVLASATKHNDVMLLSRFYNWRAGSYKGGYTHGAVYTLKADAPDDAVESISKNFLVPMFEKLLAEGAIAEYDIDVEAIHTDAPGNFFVYYFCPNAGGLDKVNVALRETLKKSPMTGPALSSMVDFKPHRDYLAHSNATFK